MHPHHVLIDDLEGEVLLVSEVVIERTLGRARRLEHGLDSQTVVAMLEEHGEADVEQPLLGRVRQAETFAIMWSITMLCSRSGLNITISASASTRTLCPAGQWNKSWACAVSCTPYSSVVVSAPLST